MQQEWARTKQPKRRTDRQGSGWSWSNLGFDDYDGGGAAEGGWGAFPSAQW
jgi:hypothetical protein